MQRPFADFGKLDLEGDAVAIRGWADETKVDFAHDECRAVTLNHFIDRRSQRPEKLVFRIIEPRQHSWIVHETKRIRFSPGNRNFSPIHHGSYTPRITALNLPSPVLSCVRQVHAFGSCAPTNSIAKLRN